MLTGIIRISAVYVGSAVWPVSRPYFRSLFLVFGSYLFLCAGVCSREFALIIVKWIELISDE